MNDTQRLRLQEMIKVNNVEDQTNVIRELKHSSILKKELQNILNPILEYFLKEIDCLHDRGISYENLIWHPKFDLEKCDLPGKKFVLSIDLSGGGSGDFTVINIFKVIKI